MLCCKIEKSRRGTSGEYPQRIVYSRKLATSLGPWLIFNSLHAVIFFHDILSSADFFSKLTFSKNYYKNTIKVPNSFDPDRARHLVGPDLYPNCLQRLSADDTSRLRVKATGALSCSQYHRYEWH